MVRGDLPAMPLPMADHNAVRHGIKAKLPTQKQFHRRRISTPRHRLRSRPFTAEENAYEEKRQALADLEKKRKEYERLQRLHAAEIEQQLSMVAEEQSDYGTAGNSNPRYR